MKFFNKSIIIILLLITFTSCNYKSEIERKNYLIDSLEVALTKLKETPNGFFLIASEKYKEGNFIDAINKLKSLENRFSSNNYKEDHKTAKTLIIKYKNEESIIVNQVLTKVKKLNAQESIRLIEDTQNKYTFSENLNIKLDKALERNKKLYEDQKSILEAEKQTGFKIISIKSSWQSSLNKHNTELMLVPNLVLKVKNISSTDINKLVIKATFIKSNNEVFGTYFDYAISSSYDTPLKPEQSIISIISSNIGLSDPYGYTQYNLPSLKAEIYINDIFYKSVWINKNVN